MKNNYITIPDSEDWNFGSGDFTIDFRVKLKSSKLKVLFWKLRYLYQKYIQRQNFLCFYIYPDRKNNGDL